MLLFQEKLILKAEKELQKFATWHQEVGLDLVANAYSKCKGKYELIVYCCGVIFPTGNTWLTGRKFLIPRMMTHKCSLQSIKDGYF